MTPKAVYPCFGIVPGSRLQVMQNDIGVPTKHSDGSALGPFTSPRSSTKIRLRAGPVWPVVVDGGHQIEQSVRVSASRATREMMLGMGMAEGMT